MNSREVLTRYQKLIDGHPDVERKGAETPYTSLKGNMFSFVTAEGRLALRLPADVREELVMRRKAKACYQHGKLMREYIVVSDGTLRTPSMLKELFMTSYLYARTLKPKATTRPPRKPKAAMRPKRKPGANKRPRRKQE